MFINPDTLSDYDKYNRYFDVGEGLHVHMTEKETKMKTRGMIMGGGPDGFTGREYDRLVSRGERINERSQKRLCRILISKMKKNPNGTDYYFEDGKKRSPKELKAVLEKLSPSIFRGRD